MQVAAQRVHGVLDLGQAGRQHLSQLAELRLVLLLRLHLLTGAVQRDHGAVLIVVQTLQRALGGVEQRLRVGQAAVFGVERFPFVGERRQFCDLADLPGQAFALALQ